VPNQKWLPACAGMTGFFVMYRAAGLKTAFIKIISSMPCAERCLNIIHLLVYTISNKLKKEMTMRWILLANSNECRIYDYEKKTDTLTCLKRIDHPENKLKTNELVTDRQGRYRSSNSAHGAYGHDSEPHEIQIDNFAREIARVLEEARISKQYKELVVVAPPAMDGLLNTHLKKTVQNLVVSTILKNIMHLNDHELVPFFRDHL
jgi:protein required for attachment to host cells